MALSYPLTAPSASDQSSAAASTEQPTVVQGRAPTEQKRSVYRSDPALIQACINGDQSGWNELVDRYGRLVYSIPQRYGLSATDADDVFQNVFTIVLRRLESLRDQTRLSAWLITTTHRECWRLAKGTKPHAELDEALVDSTTSASEHVQRWERQERVREAIAELDPRCQELVRCLFLDANDPSYQEIADRLGMAIGSIGPTRARCFKKLEAILKELEIDLDS